MRPRRLRFYSGVKQSDRFKKNIYCTHEASCPGSLPLGALRDLYAGRGEAVVAAGAAAYVREPYVAP